MLPRVKIVFENGKLGSTAPSSDGVVGLVCTATGVEGDGKLKLNTTYILRDIAELHSLGVLPDSGDNALLYKQVSDFFSEAGTGAELWLLCLPNTYTQSQLVDKSNDYAKKLLVEANGRIKVLAIAVEPATEAQVAKGLSSDTYTAISKAQELAVYMTEEKYSPVVILLEGRQYNGKPVELTDLTTMDNNRVVVLIGDVVKNSKGAAVGLLLGRIAKIPVQRHIGRVADGAVPATEVFVGGSSLANADVTTLNGKGFVSFRTFVGRAGSYFTDDTAATKVTDDYHSIARRRTIDKAYRIAYNKLLDYVNTELPITEAGTLVAAFAKSIENDVEQAIANEMLPEGNLGVDTTSASDKGVKCYVDLAQNVVSQNRLEVVVKVKPYGYAKYIDVKLGFITIKN